MSQIQSEVPPKSETVVNAPTLKRKRQSADSKKTDKPTKNVKTNKNSNVKSKAQQSKGTTKTSNTTKGKNVKTKEKQISKSTKKNTKAPIKKPDGTVKRKKMTQEAKAKAKEKLKTMKEKAKKRKEIHDRKEKEKLLKAEKKPTDFRKFVIISVDGPDGLQIPITEENWKNTKLKSNTPANAAKKAGNELVRCNFESKVGTIVITVEEKKRRGLRQVSRSQFRYTFTRFKKSEADYKEVDFTKKKKTDVIDENAEMKPPKKVAFKYDCRIKAIREIKQTVTKKAKTTTIVEPEAPECNML